MPTLHHVILDTDIGSDVDDAMALAQLMGTPSVELLGVTTVYGDTLLRARLARRLASLAGRSVDVYVGLSTPSSGREVWWPGHEGVLYDDLQRETVEEAGAVEFLVEAVLARPGAIEIVAIGPLTNIAAAIEADPRFAGAVGHLWVMGGSFTGEDVEHNIRSDSAAASVVFASGIAATVTGLEVTKQVQIASSQLHEIAASGPLGRALEADIHQWWEFWDTQWNVPHDPITVLTMTEPGLFTLSAPGRIHVVTGGADDGRTVFSTAEPGNARITTGLDALGVGASIVRSIVRAASEKRSEGAGPGF